MWGIIFSHSPILCPVDRDDIVPLTDTHIQTFLYRVTENIVNSKNLGKVWPGTCKPFLGVFRAHETKGGKRYPKMVNDLCTLLFIIKGLSLLLIS